MKYDEILAAEEGGLFVKSGEEYSRLAPPTQTTEYSFPGALLFGDEKATVGYHEGTKYLEETVTPDLFYYMLGSTIEESVTLGKTSYATISTSNLKNGIYALYDDNSESIALLRVNR